MLVTSVPRGRIASRGLLIVFCLLALSLPLCAVETNDPLCSLTNLLRAGSTASSLPASTQRMVDRLNAIRGGTNAQLGPFSSNDRVRSLQTQVQQAPNLRQQLPLRYQLGLQLLNAGRSDEALREFESMEAAITAGSGTMDRRSAAQIRMRKVLALLRIGEQENCLTNHNNQSCLFPLAREARHALPRGSRGAIELIEQHLRDIPDDLSGRWLLNIAYMTLGEYPEKVPTPWLIPPTAFASEFDLPRFPEVASGLGIDVDGLAGGSIADDFDNDGFIDIVASVWGFGGQIRYFNNDGKGSFVERTAEAGLSGLVGGLNIQQTDYNNDGFLDIWVTRGAWLSKQGRIPNSLLRNNGDGTFTDVTEQASLLSFHPTQTSVWFDFDGDGWLDLFVGNESTDRKDPDPCELFRNNGDGTFTECASAVGLRVTRFVKGVTAADYDRDGRPDLYLSCRREGANLLFHNDGPGDGAKTNGFSWRFSESSRRAGVHDTNLISFPTWFFDYNNDGWEDLFVSGYSLNHVGEVAADYLGLPHGAALPRLYENNRDGTFSDVTAARKLNRVCLTMGCNFGDLDNDGWLDFYLGTGNPDFATLIPNRMFRNAEGRYFQDVTTATGTGHLQKGHGVSFADLDNDGDQDVYTVMGGAYTGDNYRNALFLNPGNSNQWLKLKLEGVRANRAAIGARIKVAFETPSGPRSVFKTVNSGSSFGANPLRQEFGLGDATRITGVEVVWPGSGAIQSFDGIELNHAYRIREGNRKPVPMGHRTIAFDLTGKSAHAHEPHSSP